MKREIRFRAWDKDQEEMRAVELLKLPFEVSDLNEIIIMQYTGLKDKKGIDIYEGDIVRDSLKNIWIIEWTDGGGKLLPGYQLKRTQALIAFINGEVEVIGNIYEDPELLK